MGVWETRPPLRLSLLSCELLSLLTPNAPALDPCRVIEKLQGDGHTSGVLGGSDGKITETQLTTGLFLLPC